MTKVIWTSLIPSPYRVDFFNELGRFIDLTVVFLKDNDKNRDKTWYKSHFQNFKCFFLKTNNKSNSIMTRRQLVRLCIKSDYDIVVVSNIDSIDNILLMRKLIKEKKKYLIEADGGFQKNGKGIKEIVKKYLIGHAAFCLSSGICCDAYFEKYGAKKANILRYPFTSIRNKDVLTKTLSNHEKRELRKKLGMPLDNKIVLTVGQFIHRKGFDILLESIEQIKDKTIHFYIVGGDATPEYLHFVKSHFIKNVHFVGFLNNAELKKYYCAADLFVFPTREDIWGLVLNEALSNGLPVISTNKSGAAFELIKDNGLIIEANNSVVLASSIEKVLGSDLKEYSIHSLEIARNFTIETMVETHLNIFRSILEDE